MGLEPKPFTQISKERMKNKIRCAGQDYLATPQAEPARIRALLLAVGLSHNKDKRKDDSLVNKFPILSSFLFILTRLVAYPKYRSNNPFNALP